MKNIPRGIQMICYFKKKVLTSTVPFTFFSMPPIEVHDKVFYRFSKNLPTTILPNLLMSSNQTVYAS